MNPDGRMYLETISQEEIDKMEPAVFSGPITVITGPGPELEHAIRHLSEERFVGFDTETKPVFTPHAHRNATALLQLSSRSEAFLFRLQELGLPEGVADIMADPAITKIGAAVGDDINGLLRYREFEARRFMDLQKIAFSYGIREKSVRKMAAIILGMKVSKAQQLSNWEAAELSPAQQMYAAVDAWICVEMYRKLLLSPKVELEELPVENDR